MTEMIYFPQLQTRASVQYPFRRTRRWRTLRNHLLDGSILRSHDSGSEVTEWELKYDELSDEESDAIQNLFVTVRGGLQPFVFCDPEQNLLLHSENFGHDAWVAEAGLSKNGGVADPAGGDGGWLLSNSSAAPQSIVQAIGVSSELEFCFSVWMRSSTGLAIGLTQSAGGASSVAWHRINPVWRRYAASARLGSSGENLAFGILVPAGGQMEVFGAQADAQPNPSGYKKTTSRSGVYAETFFANPELRFTAAGTNRHSTVLRLRARD